MPPHANSDSDERLTCTSLVYVMSGGANCPVTYGASRLRDSSCYRVAHGYVVSAHTSPFSTQEN